MTPEGREAAIDTVPADVLDAAKRAFAHRDRSAAVLELRSDSLLDEQRAPGPRRLEFGAEHVTVLVTVHERAQDVHLELQAVHGEVLELQVGEATVPVDKTADGCWSAHVDHGLLSAVVRTGSGRARTAWLRI